MLVQKNGGLAGLIFQLEKWTNPYENRICAPLSMQVVALKKTGSIQLMKKHS